MNTFSILFYLKREKIRKDHTAPLYARITVNGKRAEISLKRYLPAEHWDAQKGQPSKRKGKEKELAAYLESVRTKLYRHQREFQDRDETFSAKELKAAFLGVEPNNGKTLVQAFTYHNDRMRDLVGQQYAKGTLQRFETTFKHIRQFLREHYKKEDIALNKLDLAFITEFDHFLRSRRGIGNNTTVKYIALFRKIIFMSLEHGWLEVDPFARYKGKVKIVDRVYLDKEELETLGNQTLHTERLEVVRDIFLFSCYTGLAYADVSKLTHDHLFRGVDGQHWIRINRTKTDTQAMIPVLPIAKSLIDKYSDHPEVAVRGCLLPIRSNQKMNAYLKEIAAICGINKVLTFHIARHTFATTVTLANGVPIESVSAMLGHTNIQTTQHYAKIVQSKVGEDMKALQEKMQAGKRDADEAQIKKLS